MPLRALIEGRDLVAPLLDDVEWEALRANSRARRLSLGLPCCDSSAFPRVSKLGTRHFVHRQAGSCRGSGETFQHLWIKAEIVEACEAAGWRAQPEVTGEGWRADVLASRGEARVAFEVQWSPQDEATLRARQERYAAAGIRACWLYRGDVPAPSRELPVFRLHADEERVATVQLGGSHHAVRDFVGALFAGKVRFVPSRIARLHVTFKDMPCWRCHKPAHIFSAGQSSLCGYEFDRAFWGRPHYTIDEFDPHVLAVVHQWLAGQRRGAGIALGAIKRRYSRTMESSYQSFGCPHCDALFGSFFVYQADGDETASFEADIPAIGLDGRHEHWCLPADGCYCDGHAISWAA